MVLGASALAGLVGRQQLRQMGSAQRFPLFLLFLREIISGLFRVRRGNPGFPWFGSRQNSERVRCFAAVFRCYGNSGCKNCIDGARAKSLGLRPHQQT
jgi:hypothetical protein